MKTIITIISLLAVIFVPFNSMQADTATQLAATINGFTGGGTGKLSASVVGNTVTVTGSLTGVKTGTIPGMNINMDMFKYLPPAATKGISPDLIKNLTSGLTLDIDAGVTIVWNALMSTGSDFTLLGSLITLFGSGTFEVTGGKIEANDNDQTAHAIAIQYKESTLTIKISGGTVSASKGNAVFDEGKKSKIIVSGTGLVQCMGAGWSAIATNGNVEVRDNAEVDGYSCAISAGGSLLSISGGTVTAIGEIGTTIKSMGDGAKVTVSGGTVSNMNNGLVIYAQTGDGTVTVTGGLVFAGNTTGNTIGERNVILTEYNPDGFKGATGTGVIIAWNRTAGHESYVQGSSEGIIKSPASATAVWDIKGASAGISYANGSNTGFITLNVTVQ